MAWIRGTIQQAGHRLLAALALQTCARIEGLGHRELSGMARGVGSSQPREAPMVAAAAAAT